MIPCRPPRRLAGLHPARIAAPALALLAACGDSSGPLESSQVDELGAALRDEAETTVAGFTPIGVLLPFSERRVPTSAGGGFAPLPLCADASPDASSSDADIVPDSAVFTFTVPPCSYTDVRDGRVEVSGLVELVDPAPSVTGFDYRATLADLAYRYVSADLEGTYTVLRSGTRTLAGTGAGLSLDVNLQVLRALADLDAAVTLEWTATFTPAEGTAAAPDQALPDGTITIVGTLEWRRVGEAFSLAVTTPTPLVYDANCTDTPQRVRDGELRAAGTFDGQEGYVQLLWNGCGDEPDIRFVAAGE
jgi:hypothetical protein